LDLSKCSKFTTLNASRSGLTSVTFAKGAPVNKLNLPLSMIELNLSQLPELSFGNITIEDSYNLSNIESIKISECHQLSNNFDIIYNWFKTKKIDNDYATLYIDSISWQNIDTDKLIELGSIKNL
jgi:hypothetical protein